MHTTECKLVEWFKGFYITWVCIGIATCSLCVATVSGQSLAFERLDIEAFNPVTSFLHIDDKGYLWGGTQRELVRYDGSSSPRIFTPGTHLSVNDDMIRVIISDPQVPGSIITGSNRGRVSRFDPVAEQFIDYSIDDTPLDLTTVRSLHLEGDSILWIGSEKGGLGTFRLQRDTLFVVDHYLEGQTINDIIESEVMPGVFWVATDSGVQLITKAQTKPLSSVESTINLPLELEGKWVTELVEIGQSLWFGTRDGALYRYDASVNKTERVDQQLNVEFGEISVLQASVSFPHLLRVGTRGKGMYEVDLRDYSYNRYDQAYQDEASISGSDVLCMQESETVLWLCTNGIDKAIVDPPVLSPVLIENLNGFPNRTSVLTLAPVQDSDQVWLSIMREGLFVHDPATSSLVRPSGIPDSYDLIFSLLQQKDGTLWMGLDQSFLVKYNPQSGEVKEIPLGTGINVRVLQIKESRQNARFLWVSTVGLGLILFDTQLEQVVNVFGRNEGLSGDNIWGIYEPEGPENIVWVLGDQTGLNRLELRTQENEIINTNTSLCLPSDDMISIYPVSDTLLWIGTFDAGLVRYNLRNDTCDVYGEVEGLSAVDIAAITPDKSGRLWLSSNHGLFVFDPSIDAFMKLDARDGVQDDVYYYQAWFVSNTGKIYAGGEKGYNVFDPNTIEISTAPSFFEISNMDVQKSPYPFRSVLQKKRRIRLDHTQRDLAFNYAVLDLSRPEKNTYRVRLLPIEDDWQIPELGVQQPYTSLAPGSYQFQVKAANSNGVWSEVNEIPFRINPPPWRSWWFRTLAVCFFIGLLVGGYQYRIAQIQRVEDTRRKIARDLHDELGVRMSLQAWNIELAMKMLEEAPVLREKLSELAGAERELVSDLRNIVWLINIEFDRLPKLVERMRQLTGKICEKRFRFTFEQPDHIPDIFLDMEYRKNVFFFFQEGMHNVLRHSEATYVAIDIGLDTQTLHLTIKDDGKGFDKASVIEGQGLTSLREREKNLNGTLEIDSNPGKGTRLYLKVPLPQKRRWIHGFTGWLWPF